ncbi:neuropeptide CCHamide-2 receptor-like [Ptychodera flava]|uniref:neuropeptide CCHamide-2 receptor-like n=1 Tax=Ptychodera flava TaxID=63121 RepID=UPI003969F6D2
MSVMCENIGVNSSLKSCFLNNSFEMGNYSFDVCSVDNSTLDLIAAVVGTIGIIGNVTFMLVVCRIPYMRNATNYFLISLATSDLLYLLGHTICREDWYADTDWIHEKGNREILQCVRWGSTTPSYSSSILSVMFISIERYLAICKPFTRQSKGLKKSSRVIILVLSSWVFGAAIGLSGLLRCYMEKPSDGVILIVNYAYTIVEVVTFFLSLMVVIVLYTIAAKRLKMSTYDIAYSPTNIRDRSQVMRLCIVTAAVYFTCIFPRIVFQMAAFYDLLEDEINIQDLLTCLNEMTLWRSTSPGLLATV